MLAALTEGVPRTALFSDIADGFVRAADSERAFLFRFRKGGGFQILAARDVDGESIENAQDSISHFAVRELERAEEPIVIGEARVDRRYRTEEVFQGRTPPCSLALAPIRASGLLVGGLYFDHRFRVFPDDLFDSAPVRAWLDLCGIAVRLRELRARCRLLETRLSRRESVESVNANSASMPTTRVPRERPETVRDVQGFITSNPDLLDVLDDIERVSSSDLPVLIRGETGNGKTRLAKVVHQVSTRADRAFEVFSCGAIPDTLVESELFGHVKGAFTGAENDREGLFSLADGGTLLLDEIADLSPTVQTKLLRVLEDGLVRPLGSNEDAVSVDVRVLATTRFDPDALVTEGKLREDLLYRLKTLVFTIPPLRERWEDIPSLSALFLERYTRDGQAASIDAAALDRLMAYPWPGNVRELENELRRLSALGVTQIDLSVLADVIVKRGAGSDRVGAGLEEVIAEAERGAIVAALSRSGGNKSRTASMLGITRKALYRRLAKYGIGGAGPEEEAT